MRGEQERWIALEDESAALISWIAGAGKSSSMGWLRPVLDEGAEVVVYDPKAGGHRTVYGPPLSDVPCHGRAPYGGPVRYHCPVCGRGFHAAAPYEGR